MELFAVSLRLLTKALAATPVGSVCNNDANNKQTIHTGLSELPWQPALSSCGDARIRKLTADIEALCSPVEEQMKTMQIRYNVQPTTQGLRDLTFGALSFG